MPDTRIFAHFKFCPEVGATRLTARVPLPLHDAAWLDFGILAISLAPKTRLWIRAKVLVRRWRLAFSSISFRRRYRS